VLPIDESRVVTKWRLQPGKMLLIDLGRGRIVSDDEIKAELARAHPYREWLARTQIVLEDLPAVPKDGPETDVSLLDRQQAFGYTEEDIKLLMQPMAVTGQEAVGSMGNDAPISALSDKSKLLYTYFKQNFAQVTNPPIDPIREELVMSLVSFIGPRPNLFDLKGQGTRKRLEVRQPILTNEDLEKIRAIGEIKDNPFQSKTLDITYPAATGAAGMVDALAGLCRDAIAAVEAGYNIIILSDRMVGPGRIPIPSLLATAPRSAWSWRPATRARSIISRCWPATAPRRSIPTSPSRRSSPCSATCRRKSTSTRSSTATSSRSTRAS
jgi:glutamate synthase (NADPH/NADH) large chain